MNGEQSGSFFPNLDLSKIDRVGIQTHLEASRKTYKLVFLLPAHSKITSLPPWH